LAAGLTIRPLAQSVGDTLAWYQGLPADQRVFTRAGLSPDRESAALSMLARG
jgi:2'-hydroxyisoflavone reductase